MPSPNMHPVPKFTPLVTFVKKCSSSPVLRRCLGAAGVLVKISPGSHQSLSSMERGAVRLFSPHREGHEGWHQAQSWWMSETFPSTSFHCLWGCWCWGCPLLQPKIYILLATFLVFKSPRDPAGPLEAGVDIAWAQSQGTTLLRLLLATGDPQKLCVRSCSIQAEEIPCTSGISKQSRENAPRVGKALPLSLREFGKEGAKCLIPKYRVPKGCLERCCGAGSWGAKSPWHLSHSFSLVHFLTSSTLRRSTSSTQPMAQHQNHEKEGDNSHHWDDIYPFLNFKLFSAIHFFPLKKHQKKITTNPFVDANFCHFIME